MLFFLLNSWGFFFQVILFLVMSFTRTDCFICNSFCAFNLVSFLSRVQNNVGQVLKYFQVSLASHYLNLSWYHFE